MTEFGTFDDLLGGIDPIRAGGLRNLGLSMTCWVELTQPQPTGDNSWRPADESSLNIEEKCWSGGGKRRQTGTISKGIRSDKKHL